MTGQALFCHSEAQAEESVPPGNGFFASLRMTGQALFCHSEAQAEESVSLLSRRPFHSLWAWERYTEAHACL